MNKTKRTVTQTEYTDVRRKITNSNEKIALSSSECRINAYTSGIVDVSLYYVKDTNEYMIFSHSEISTPNRTTFDGATIETCTFESLLEVLSSSNCSVRRTVKEHAVKKLNLK